MARTGHPKAVLELSEQEREQLTREQLTRWARRAKTSQALTLRSKIILACATGSTNASVSAQLGCTATTVGKWRARFVADRLDGLFDEPRSGRPATVTDQQVEDLVVATLESVPDNATHWTRSKMARRSGLSASTVGRIWRAFGLQPHRTETFKLSTDPLLVEKAYDIGPGTPTPNPSSGPKPPKTSSNPSEDFSLELPARDTSRG